MDDPFKTLNIPKTATDDEIKNAYRRLAQRHHPDKGGEAETFAKISDAFTSLKNRPQQQKFIRTIRATITITYDDLAEYVPKQALIAIDGASFAINIYLPAGLEHLDSVKYPHIGPHGEDIILTFNIQDRRFGRSKFNLLKNINVPAFLMMVGGEIDIAGLCGRVISLVIPPCSTEETVLRVAGQGLLTNDHTNGDMLVSMKPMLPKTLSATLKAAILDSITPSPKGK